LCMELDDPYSHPLANVLYCPENVPGLGCEEELFEEDLRGCDCCSHACPCTCLTVTRQGQKMPNYQGNQYLHLDIDQPLLECHSGCKCNPALCRNRVSQRGPMAGLSIEHTNGKGYGLFTKQFVPRGTFVCTYSGEVISEEVAKARLKAQDIAGQDNYIIFARERRINDGEVLSVTIVDPTAIGNVGRYANHSCDPSLAMHLLRRGSPVPELALFASRDIQVNEELTFDYGGGSEGDSQSGSNRKACLCDSSKCRKWLPFCHELTA